MACEGKFATELYKLCYTLSDLNISSKAQRRWCKSPPPLMIRQPWDMFRVSRPRRKQRFVARGGLQCPTVTGSRRVMHPSMIGAVGVTLLRMECSDGAHLSQSQQPGCPGSGRVEAVAS